MAFKIRAGLRSATNPLVPKQENKHFVSACFHFFMDNKTLVITWMLFSTLSYLCFILFLCVGVFAYFFSQATVNNSTAVTNTQLTTSGHLLGSWATHLTQLSHQAPLIYGIVSLAIATICWYSMYYVNFTLTYMFMQRLQDKKCTWRQGLKRAAACKWRILQWALLSVCVHRLLVMLEDRFSWASAITVSILGCAWGLASFFVAPIIIDQNCGPLSALKLSAKTLKQHYGKAFRLGIFFSFIALAITGCFILYGYAAQYYNPNWYLSTHFWHFVLFGFISAIILGKVSKAINLIGMSKLYLLHFKADSP